MILQTFDVAKVVVAGVSACGVSASRRRGIESQTQVILSLFATEIAITTLYLHVSVCARETEDAAVLDSLSGGVGHEVGI